MRSFKASLRRASVDSLVLDAMNKTDAHGLVEKGAVLKVHLPSLVSAATSDLESHCCHEAGWRHLVPAEGEDVSSLAAEADGLADALWDDLIPDLQENEDEYEEETHEEAPEMEGEDEDDTAPPEWMQPPIALADCPKKPAEKMCKFLALRLRYGNPSAKDFAKAQEYIVG
eukprot:2793849-Amphidinium_carterae.1